MKKTAKKNSSQQNTPLFSKSVGMPTKNRYTDTSAHTGLVSARLQSQILLEPRPV